VTQFKWGKGVSIGSPGVGLTGHEEAETPDGYSPATQRGRKGKGLVNRERKRDVRRIALLKDGAEG
jgi:hypothetical protein